MTKIDKRFLDLANQRSQELNQQLQVLANEDPNAYVQQQLKRLSKTYKPVYEPVEIDIPLFGTTRLTQKPSIVDEYNPLVLAGIATPQYARRLRYGMYGALVRTAGTVAGFLDFLNPSLFHFDKEKVQSYAYEVNKRAADGNISFWDQIMAQYKARQKDAIATAAEFNAPMNKINEALPQFDPKYRPPAWDDVSTWGEFVPSFIENLLPTVATIAATAASRNPSFLQMAALSIGNTIHDSTIEASNTYAELLDKYGDQQKALDAAADVFFYNTSTNAALDFAEFVVAALPAGRIGGAISRTVRKAGKAGKVVDKLADARKVASKLPGSKVLDTTIGLGTKAFGLALPEGTQEVWQSSLSQYAEEQHFGPGGRSVFDIFYDYFQTDAGLTEFMGGALGGIFLGGGGEIPMGLARRRQAQAAARGVLEREGMTYLSEYIQKDVQLDMLAQGKQVPEGTISADTADAWSKAEEHPLVKSAPDEVRADKQKAAAANILVDQMLERKKEDLSKLDKDTQEYIKAKLEGREPDVKLDEKSKKVAENYLREMKALEETKQKNDALLKEDPETIIKRRQELAEQLAEAVMTQAENDLVNGKKESEVKARYQLTDEAMTMVKDKAAMRRIAREGKGLGALLEAWRKGEVTTLTPGQAKFLLEKFGTENDKERQLVEDENIESDDSLAKQYEAMRREEESRPKLKDMNKGVMLTDGEKVFKVEGPSKKGDAYVLARDEEGNLVDVPYGDMKIAGVAPDVKVDPPADNDPSRIVQDEEATSEEGTTTSEEGTTTTSSETTSSEEETVEEETATGGTTTVLPPGDPPGPPPGPPPLPDSSDHQQSHTSRDPQDIFLVNNRIATYFYLEESGVLVITIPNGAAMVFTGEDVFKQAEAAGFRFKVKKPGRYPVLNSKGEPIHATVWHEVASRFGGYDAAEVAKAMQSDFKGYEVEITIDTERQVPGEEIMVVVLRKDGKRVAYLGDLPWSLNTAYQESTNQIDPVVAELRQRVKDGGGSIVMDAHEAKPSIISNRYVATEQRTGVKKLFGKGKVLFSNGRVVHNSPMEPNTTTTVNTWNRNKVYTFVIVRSPHTGHDVIFPVFVKSYGEVDVPIRTFPEHISSLFDESMKANDFIQALGEMVRDGRLTLEQANEAIGTFTSARYVRDGDGLHLLIHKNKVGLDEVSSFLKDKRIFFNSRNFKSDAFQRLFFEWDLGELDTTPDAMWQNPSVSITYAPGFEVRPLPKQEKPPKPPVKVRKVQPLKTYQRELPWGTIEITKYNDNRYDFSYKGHTLGERLTEAQAKELYDQLSQLSEPPVDVDVQVEEEETPPPPPPPPAPVKGSARGYSLGITYLSPDGTRHTLRINGTKLILDGKEVSYKEAQQALEGMTILHVTPDGRLAIDGEGVAYEAARVFHGDEVVSRQQATIRIKGKERDVTIEYLADGRRVVRAGKKVIDGDYEVVRAGRIEDVKDNAITRLADFANRFIGFSAYIDTLRAKGHDLAKKWDALVKPLYRERYSFSPDGKESYAVTVTYHSDGSVTYETGGKSKTFRSYVPVEEVLRVKEGGSLTLEGRSQYVYDEKVDQFMRDHAPKKEPAPPTVTDDDFPSSEPPWVAQYDEDPFYEQPYDPPQLTQPPPVSPPPDDGIDVRPPEGPTEEEVEAAEDAVDMDVSEDHAAVFDKAANKYGVDVGELFDAFFNGTRDKRLAGIVKVLGRLFRIMRSMSIGSLRSALLPDTVEEHIRRNGTYDMMAATMAIGRTMRAVLSLSEGRFNEWIESNKDVFLAMVADVYHAATGQRAIDAKGNFTDAGQVLRQALNDAGILELLVDEDAMDDVEAFSVSDRTEDPYLRTSATLRRFLSLIPDVAWRHSQPDTEAIERAIAAADAWLEQQRLKHADKFIKRNVVAEASLDGQPVRVYQRIYEDGHSEYVVTTVRGRQIGTYETMTDVVDAGISIDGAFTETTEGLNAFTTKTLLEHRIRSGVDGIEGNELYAVKVHGMETYTSGKAILYQILNLMTRERMHVERWEDLKALLDRHTAVVPELKVLMDILDGKTNMSTAEIERIKSELVHFARNNRHYDVVRTYGRNRKRTSKFHRYVMSISRMFKENVFRVQVRRKLESGSAPIQRRLIVGDVFLSSAVFKEVESLLGRHVRANIDKAIDFYMKQVLGLDEETYQGWEPSMAGIAPERFAKMVELYGEEHALLITKLLFHAQVSGTKSAFNALHAALNEGGRALSTAAVESLIEQTIDHNIFGGAGRYMAFKVVNSVIPSLDYHTIIEGGPSRLSDLFRTVGIPVSDRFVNILYRTIKLAGPKNETFVKMVTATLRSAGNAAISGKLNYVNGAFTNVPVVFSKKNEHHRLFINMLATYDLSHLEASYTNVEGNNEWAYNKPNAIHAFAARIHHHLTHAFTDGLFRWAYKRYGNYNLMDRIAMLFQNVYYYGGDNAKFIDESPRTLLRDLVIMAHEGYMSLGTMSDSSSHILLQGAKVVISEDGKYYIQFDDPLVKEAVLSRTGYAMQGDGQPVTISLVEFIINIRNTEENLMAEGKVPRGRSVFEGLEHVSGVLNEKNRQEIEKWIEDRIEEDRRTMWEHGLDVDENGTIPISDPVYFSKDREEVRMDTRHGTILHGIVAPAIRSLIEGHPAFTKNEVDRTKRSKAVATPGEYLTVDNMDTDTFELAVVEDEVVDLDELVDELPVPEDAKEELRESFRGIEATDGISYINIHMLRQVYKGMLRWTEQMEAWYQKVKRWDTLSKEEQQALIAQAHANFPFLFQSLKPHHASMEGHNPVFIKTSAMPLMPWHGERSESARRLLDLMGDKPRMVSVASAAKKWMNPAVPLSEATESHFVPLSFYDYKHVQNVGFKATERSQVRNNVQQRKITAELIDDSVTVEGRSGRELKKHYFDVVFNIVKQRIKAILKEVGTPDGLGKAMKRMMSETAMSLREASYLLAGLHPYHPALVRAAVKTMRAFIKNNDFRFKQRGFAAPIIPSLTAPRKPRVYVDDNGELVVEAYIPLLDRRLAALMDENGLVNPDDLGPLKDIVMFRIPAEGPYSVYKVRVIGFTDGNIVLPDALVALTGHDFDIDKMYAYLPTYAFKDGKVVAVTAKQMYRASKSKKVMKRIGQFKRFIQAAEAQARLAAIEGKQDGYATQDQIDHLNTLLATPIFADAGLTLGEQRLRADVADKLISDLEAFLGELAEIEEMDIDVSDAPSHVLEQYFVELTTEITRQRQSESLRPGGFARIEALTDEVFPDQDAVAPNTMGNIARQKNLSIGAKQLTGLVNAWRGGLYLIDQEHFADKRIVRTKKGKYKFVKGGSLPRAKVFNQFAELQAAIVDGAKNMLPGRWGLSTDGIGSSLFFTLFSIMDMETALHLWKDIQPHLEDIEMAIAAGDKISDVLEGQADKDLIYAITHVVSMSMKLNEKIRLARTHEETLFMGKEEEIMRDSEFLFKNVSHPISDPYDVEQVASETEDDPLYKRGAILKKLIASNPLVKEGLLHAFVTDNNDNRAFANWYDIQKNYVKVNINTAVKKHLEGVLAVIPNDPELKDLLSAITISDRGGMMSFRLDRTYIDNGLKAAMMADKIDHLLHHGSSQTRFWLESALLYSNLAYGFNHHPDGLASVTPASFYNMKVDTPDGVKSLLEVRRALLLGNSKNNCN
ncbi:MAG: hypothetical protein D6746_08590 [Bacteroidetes bacterium]|nr:MAG: hypothetical protein D6746_08590 [Bacteroidota bacterium]